MYGSGVVVYRVLCGFGRLCCGLRFIFGLVLWLCTFMLVWWYVVFDVVYGCFVLVFVVWGVRFVWCFVLVSFWVGFQVDFDLMFCGVALLLRGWSVVGVVFYFLFWLI